MTNVDEIEFNVEIEKMKQQINRVQEDVGENKDKLSELEGEIDSNSSSVIIPAFNISKSSYYKIYFPKSNFLEMLTKCSSTYFLSTLMSITGWSPVALNETSSSKLSIIE